VSATISHTLLLLASFGAAAQEADNGTMVANDDYSASFKIKGRISCSGRCPSSTAYVALVDTGLEEDAGLAPRSNREFGKQDVPVSMDFSLDAEYFWGRKIKAGSVPYPRSFTVVVAMNGCATYSRIFDVDKLIRESRVLQVDLENVILDCGS
jgi:hypothetical protein